VSTRLGSRGATLLVVALVTAAATLAWSGGGSASASARTLLSASSAPFATPGALVRAARPGEPVDFEMQLGWRDPQAAEALLQRVSDPARGSYAHYLTPAQFRARFSRSSAAVARVSSWLSSQGFRVGSVPANHLWVPATGTVQQAQRAFGTRLAYYRTGGHTLRATSSAPSIPTSLADVVEGVTGLTQVLRSSGVQAPPAYRGGTPCSQFWGQKMTRRAPTVLGKHVPIAPCGYTPVQLQNAYGMRDAIRGGTDGAGVTVGVIDPYNSPTMQKDLNRYSDRHHLPRTTIQSIVKEPTYGGLAYQQGWWSEQTLDIEAVHAMAPGASILYWGAKSPYDHPLLNAANDIVDNARADLVTNSWGSADESAPRASTNAWHSLFLEAGAVGIGFYFASGDEGDNVKVLGHRSVELSASDPAATAVGGTSLAVGALGAYLFETGWGTARTLLVHGRWKPHPPGAWWAGGTGGTSRIFAEPGYQRGVVPSRLATWWHGHNRVVPDISMVADPYTGFVIGETQKFPDGVRYGEYALGGTSLSSPLMAGVMALADDAAGFSHGFANPALYDLSGTGALRDVRTPRHKVSAIYVGYNNQLTPRDGRYYRSITMNQTGTLHTRRGYDDVTGVGTPRGQAFLDALS
jgi:subtilase family serine protease